MCLVRLFIAIMIGVSSLYAMEEGIHSPKEPVIAAPKLSRKTYYRPQQQNPTADTSQTALLKHLFMGIQSKGSPVVQE